MRDIEQLQHHSIVRIHEIGRSVLNKPIIELQIGEGETYVHMNASFHANEWITSAVVMAFVRDYVQALKDKQHLFGYDVQPLYKKRRYQLCRWSIQMESILCYMEGKRLNIMKRRY